jgi:biotin carboxyl carrier protein
LRPPPAAGRAEYRGARRSDSRRSDSNRDSRPSESRPFESRSRSASASASASASGSESFERPSARGSNPEIRVGSQPQIRVGSNSESRAGSNPQIPTGSQRVGSNPQIPTGSQRIGSNPQIPVGAAVDMPAAAAGANPAGANPAGANPINAPMMGAIDPLAVPVPPELGGPIYGWIRRLALQADLQGADKLLREAFIDLTSSLSVSIIYPGAEGLWSLGEDGEIPKEATPIVAVAQARRAMIATHTALIPVVTSTETVAVVVLTRNPRNPGYHPVEQLAAVALAREAAAILHHLAVAHLQRASEIKADQGGLYRGEALEAHRTRGNEGVPVNLSPSWIKRAYPFLLASILIALVASIFITVPTYSSGMGVVYLQGMPITAPAAGTVDKIYVTPGQQVKEGTPLVLLHSQQEDDELRAAQTEADNTITQYLHDPSDEMTRKTMIGALNKVDLAKARVAARVVRARSDGTVSDIRVQLGALLQPGEPILQVVDPKADPEMWAFLPGKDRPRLRPGQTLQVEIVGFTKTREKVAITYVSPETFGAAEVAKIVGPTLADSIKMPPGSYVWVKAKMPKKFKTQHSTLWYHHGMVAKTEVKIQEKPFLVTLLPSLEKYLPD